MYVKYDPKEHNLNFTFSFNPSETAALHAKLNGNAEIDIDDLRRVSLWKQDRVLSVADETLGKLRALAIDKSLSLESPTAREVLELLVASEGIGYPMASAILKFVRPDIFPIIDVRAYRALTGDKIYYGTYTFEKYIQYAIKLREMSESLDRPLREIDEQLYCFDDLHNGKI